jgi:hypothetical protein
LELVLSGIHNELQHRLRQSCLRTDPDVNVDVREGKARLSGAISHFLHQIDEEVGRRVSDHTPEPKHIWQDPLLPLHEHLKTPPIQLRSITQGDLRL